DGSPAPLARVEFHTLDAAGKKSTRVADALVQADGTYIMSTYQAFDGVPVGDYAVSVTWRVPIVDDVGKPGPNKLATKYASAATSEIRAKVSAGDNAINFDLNK